VEFEQPKSKLHQIVKKFHLILS